MNNEDVEMIDINMSGTTYAAEEIRGTLKLKELQRYISKGTVVDLIDSWDCDRGWLGTFISKMIPKEYLDNDVVSVYPGIYKGIGGEETELIILVKESDV